MRARFLPVFPAVFLPLFLAICAVLCFSLFTRVILAQAPGEPTIDSATSGTTSISIAWTAPGDIGGSAIIAYDLRYIRTDADEDVASNWTEKQDIWTSGNLRYTLSGLRRDTAFDFQVRAVNSDSTTSDGPWSATYGASTTDHGNSQSAATTLSLGSSLEGSIDPADDEDYFRIVAPSNTDLWVYTSGALDTTGELSRSGGSVLARNYDGRLVDHPLGFSMRYRLSGGTFYVKVTSHAGKYTGAYTIHAQQALSLGGSFANPTEINLDSAAAGSLYPIAESETEIDTNGVYKYYTIIDIDVFTFELLVPTEVWILVAGRFDSTLTLFNSDQQVLASNDNGGWTYNSTASMIRRSLSRGSYYLKVSGDNGDDFGPYVLYLKTVTEPGGSLADATRLTLNVPQTGNLASNTDQEYFSFTLDDETYASVYVASFDGALPVAVSGLGAMTESFEITRADYSDAGERAESYYKWGRLPADTYNISTSTTNSGGGKYLLHVRTSRYAEVVDNCTMSLTTTTSDPWYGCQWHLDNTSQFANGAEQDINVQELWDDSDPSTMGAGIRVAVVDDGMHYEHEDLTDNALTSQNRTYHRSQSSIYNPADSHGTAVASIIAGRDNSSGVRGVAPRASIFGIKIHSNVPFTNDTESGAMDPEMSNAAIFNNSWGPVTRGRLFRPSDAWEKAVTGGVNDGFGKNGILYVFSGGNGHLDGDYSNLNGFANYYGVVAVCAVNYADKRSWYSELGSNLWICAPSNSPREIPELPAITTADNEDRYRNSFGGTSAAAPIVSGVAALIRAADRGAQPILSWRDVKLILANSARKNDATDSGWRDGALKYGSTTERYSFNHEYGFGMVDAGAAVALAKTWTNLPDMRQMTGTSTNQAQTIPDAPSSVTTGRTIESRLTIDDYVEFIEFVQIDINFQHTHFGHLSVELVSPSGKRSSLSVRRDVYVANPVNGPFRFGSARHLGENSAGTWKLSVTDHRPTDTGILHSWSITVYGHGITPNEPDIDSTTAGDQTITVAWKAPDDHGTSDITKYDLRYIRSDASNKSETRWTPHTDITTDTYEIMSLEAGVYYDIQMRAHNDGGAGVWSKTEQGNTDAVAPATLNTPSVTARAAELLVTWTPPGTGQVGISRYDVRYILSSATAEEKEVDMNWMEEVAWTNGGGDLTHIIDNLTNGERYDIQARATNGQGTSEWSATRTGTPRVANQAPAFLSV